MRIVRIAGVVVAYYPDYEKLLFNIGTYVDHVEQLFIVFNSPANPEEVKKLMTRYFNLVFVFNEENIGIAAALNQSAQKALELGYDWLLTMDQDSFFPSGLFFEIVKINADKFKNAALFCPNPDAVPEMKNDGETEEILCAITSGNLLNLSAWKILKGFEEKLFIDEVDNDFCLKAALNGFKIIRFKNIPLVHELGLRKRVKFFHKKYTVITHQSFRSYYIFRNNLYIFNKYKKTFPDFVRERKIILLKGLVKIVLFSDKKIQNGYYIFRGISDYLNGSFGPFENQLKQTA